MEQIDIKKYKELQELQYAFYKALIGMIECKDLNTAEHIRRTSSYVTIIADELARNGHFSDLLTEEYIKKLSYAAQLHDIGKIFTPPTILNKPGKLTDEEFNTMKKHTLDGSKLISKILENLSKNSETIKILQIAQEIALYHHEKWNGLGYPYGISENEIPISARIMAVSDVFDALSSKRVYKEAFPIEKSVRIIEEESGNHFDPLVVKAFLESFEDIEFIYKQKIKKL